MPSARVRGTVLTGIAGLALSAMFGFAPAASADPGSSPAPLGLLGNTVGSTLSVVSPSLGRLTAALTPPASQARTHSARTPTSTGHAKGARHHAHRAAQHVVSGTDRSHGARSGHGWTGHGQAYQHHPASERHNLRPAHRHGPRAAQGAKVTAFQSSPPPQQHNEGLLGGLLGGLTSLVNGTITGVTGLIGGTTHGLGQLIGRGHSSSPPPSSPPSSPPPTNTPGGGSSVPSAPGSPTRPSSSHQRPTPAGTPAGSTPSTRAHHTLGRALPAPADLPSLVSIPSRTVVPTTRPQPTQQAGSPIAGHAVPVSLTSAPSGWVLFAAVALFAIAVVFMVLGAGYRGRRAR